MEFRDYVGMMPEMDDEVLVIDDLSHHETERLLEIYKPDIFCAGIKEKYGVQKMGIPCKQLHSYDYGGPYAGFRGAINFYNDIDRMVNMKIWSYVTPPWQPHGEAARRSCSRLSRALEQSARLDTDETAHRAERECSMLLRHTTDEVLERTALTVNPAKTCQPIGAMYAALGLHNCLPHSHGSQGCCSYHRSTLTRHYKEPVMAATSSFTEGTSVFGGQANLLQAIQTIFTVYNPDVIAVHTTCLSETIGDDLVQIIAKAVGEGKVPAGKHVIHCNTPSYSARTSPAFPA